MATTRIIAIHINKGKSIARTLKERTNYAKNPEKTVDSYNEYILADSINYAQNYNKTLGGELVKCYACVPQTVDEEFMLSKKEYEHKTARDQGDNNVLAYHIRQAFKPGEITPQLSLEIGYKLAMRFTKGKHAFIVATHTDKEHLHNHIVFNSTALSHDKKFRDFKGSGLALQKVSDLLCIEHGLSVIENPKLSKGKNYHKWLGNKEPSYQEKLRRKIDEVLPNCSTFEEFISTMKSEGYKVNANRKHITFLADGQKKPTRLNTLKGNYTEEAIREQIAKNLTKDYTENAFEMPIKLMTVKVSWLIDIEAKILEGKGKGYEQWSRIFNIKEMSKTLLYLKEQDIHSYDELLERTSKITDTFSEVSSEIKTIETRLKSISGLQHQIATYGKTREVYQAYKKSGFSKEFYETNRSQLALHEAAKNHFNSLGIKKLPKITELKQEYAELNSHKKKLYSSYHKSKDEHQELLIAKSNAEKILGINPNAQNHTQNFSNISEKSNRKTLEI